MLRLELGRWPQYRLRARGPGEAGGMADIVTQLQDKVGPPPPPPHLTAEAPLRRSVTLVLAPTLNFKS